MVKNNRDIYNYIASKSNFFLRLENFILLVVFFGLLYFYKDVFSDQNVSFYTFSTIVQGFLALVGFLGALTVFKIQLIENEAQKISTGLETSIKMYKGIEVHSYSWIEMMNACSVILENKDSNFNITEIKSGYEKLCKLRDQKSPIRNDMVSFSLVTMINVMISLLGILLSKVFISNELFLTNAFYTLLTLCLAFYSIKSAFKVIRSCLGYSFRVSL